MENLKNFYEKYRVYLTRPHLEIVAVVTIVFCAVLVFLLNIPGKGVLKLDNGSLVYDGSLVRGKMNGQGTITFSNGDTYTGAFTNGAFNGKGTFQSKEGWVYDKKRTRQKSGYQKTSFVCFLYLRMDFCSRLIVILNKNQRAN